MVLESLMLENLGVGTLYVGKYRKFVKQEIMKFKSFDLTPQELPRRALSVTSKGQLSVEGTFLIMMQ